MTDGSNTTGIYIHIPFCASRCPYCDFYSVLTDAHADAFTDAAADELRTLRRCAPFAGDIKERDIATVYFGGGTPSYIGAQRLSFLLGEVGKNFRIAQNAEITVECNPSSSLSDGFFDRLREAGFNRVSMGMQSAVDTERRKLGRLSGAADVEKAVSACQKAGFDNISLDVMLGVPEQTEESLHRTLAFADSLGVQHISAYMLSLEEGTFFYRKRASLGLPDEDAVCELYLSACEALAQMGYRHYEISNFCKEGFASRHNTAYWKCGEYLGTGPAAHSFINGKRFYYERDLDGFLAGAPAVYDCEGGGAEEYIMLGLRLDTGVSLGEIKKKYGISPKDVLFRRLKKYAENGLAVFDGDRIALTEKGFLLSNTLIGEITGDFI